MTASLKPDAIERKSESGSLRTKWSAVVKVDATEDHAFVYLDEATVQVVPKRAFPSEDAFRTFVDEARRFHQASRA